MDAHEELVLRIATRQRKQLGLSSAGYGELLIAVRNDPRHFVDSPEDEAMALMAKALKQYNDSRGGDDLLDDAEYMQARTRRMARMRRDCAEALAIDRNCIDAHLCDIIASDAEPDALLDLLLPLEVDAEKLLEPHLHEASRPAGSGVEAGHVDEIISVSDDLWNDVFARPLLRVRATMARAYFDAARYRLACAEALGTIDLSPLDLLGARHTAALAYARLEDEQGFESLDARFGRRGNAWQSLARIILLFKLGRPGVPCMALTSFARGASMPCSGPSSLTRTCPTDPLSRRIASRRPRWPSTRRTPLSWTFPTSSHGWSHRRTWQPLPCALPGAQALTGRMERGPCMRTIARQRVAYVRFSASILPAMASAMPCASSPARARRASLSSASR